MKALAVGLMMLLLAVVVATVPANAQSPVNILKVNVPFDFSVNGVMRPAGAYTVDNISTGLIAIGNWKAGRMFVLIKAKTTLKGDEKDALVFHKINDQYFLASIITSTDSSGRDLFMSRQEREKLARGERAVTTVLMAGAR
jgi:hypothetical protein